MAVKTVTKYITFDNREWQNESDALKWEEGLVERSEQDRRVDAWNSIKTDLEPYGKDLNLGAFKWLSKRGKLSFKEVFERTFIGEYPTSVEILEKYNLYLNPEVVPKV